MTAQQTLNEKMLNYYLESGLPEELFEIVTNSIIEGQKSSVKGLAIGNTAPDFVLPDIEGNLIHLYEYLRQGPVVLNFFRGSWCAFCSNEFSFLKQHLAEFEELGSQLIGIHPQDLEISPEFRDKFNATFPIVSDAEQQVISTYDLRFELTPELIALYRDTFQVDLEKLNANNMWTLPVPATFVVDTDRTIKARHFSHDYMVRMEPQDIISAIKHLPNLSEEKNYSAVYKS